MPDPVDKKLYNRVKKLADKVFDSKTGVYKSSWIVRTYKKLGGKYKGKLVQKSGLKRWYKEKWVDLNRSIGRNKYASCGRRSAKNSRVVFLNMLNLFSSYENVKILEVGTYCGTSIATMLNYLPNSVGTVIDNWSLASDELENCHMIYGKYFTMGYVRETFFKNTENLRNRLTLIENDSSKAMIDLIHTGSKFDFIYVDGSHTSLDCAMDLVLSWVLLEKNGVLGIDDYLYTKNETPQEALPKIAIDNFLKKFEGEYYILSAGFRIFLRKL